MRKTVTSLKATWAALSITLALLCSPAYANLVTNGSFETHTGKVATVGIGSTSITGWTVVGNYISMVSNASFSGTGITASDGNWLLDLTGNVGRGGGLISDAFATEIGTTYNLLFDVGAFNYLGTSYGNAIVDVWINGIAMGSFKNINSLSHSGSDWETKSFDFTADSASTRVEFRSSLSTASSNLGVGLDNIRVTSSIGTPSPVPEPLSLALFGVGLAGLALNRRRKSIKDKMA